MRPPNWNVHAERGVDGVIRPSNATWPVLLPRVEASLRTGATTAKTARNATPAARMGSTRPAARDAASGGT